MDSYKVDTTKLIRDPFKTPLPRNDPLTDLKYFTSGFIFLQDLVEQAIIRNQTGRQQLPAITMQQFPSPCYVHDTFFMGIANLFPLIMNLSFVYSASMTVKSVVHEKERRLKETMRTMGLGNAVHWLAWFIDSMSSMTVACIFLSFILVVKKRILIDKIIAIKFLEKLHFSLEKYWKSLTRSWFSSFCCASASLQSVKVSSYRRSSVGQAWLRPAEDSFTSFLSCRTTFLIYQAEITVLE
jgi:ATP-binding cassette, subfamily A (ABC1), member 4